MRHIVVRLTSETSRRAESRALQGVRCVSQMCSISRRVQFCSGLVDLVVCVSHHGGGGHRLTLAGERFVGLVAKDPAQVGDRCGDFGKHPGGHGVDCETGDSGRSFMVSEPVKKRGQHREGERIMVTFPDSW